MRPPSKCASARVKTLTGSLTLTLGGRVTPGHGDMMRLIGEGETMRFWMPLFFAAALATPALRAPPDGVDDSGDAVTYANGGYQVSYSTIKGLKGSRAGDPVKLCLTEIPDG